MVVEDEQPQKEPQEEGPLLPDPRLDGEEGEPWPSLMHPPPQKPRVAEGGGLTDAGTVDGVVLDRPRTDPPAPRRAIPEGGGDRRIQGFIPPEVVPDVPLNIPPAPGVLPSPELGPPDPALGPDPQARTTLRPRTSTPGIPQGERGDDPGEQTSPVFEPAGFTSDEFGRDAVDRPTPSPRLGEEAAASFQSPAPAGDGAGSQQEVVSVLQEILTTMQSMVSGQTEIVSAIEELSSSLEGVGGLR